MLLKEAYDIQYGLYNHDEPSLNHPWQTSLYTEKKSIKKGNLFGIWMDKYHRLQVHKYFGISFIEFMDLPIDRAEEMLFKIEQWMAEEAKGLRDIENNLNRNLREAGRDTYREYEIDPVTQNIIK